MGKMKRLITKIFEMKSTESLDLPEDVNTKYENKI